MQISPDTTVHIAIGAIAVGWLVVQLFTNGKIGEIKTDIAETNGLIKEHIASDEQLHVSFDYKISTHEKRLDKIENR